MDLLDLLVKIGVDDQASGKVDGIAGGIGSKLGAAAGKAASLVAAGVTAVAAGVAAVTGMSMSAYAAYEQNVGGIQKIFGNMGKSLEDYAAMTGQTVEQCSGKWEQLEQAQTTVLANADAAYKTAGMSANRYMEQVTGFSAALVSSLGGDTVKAAEYADTAMVDMGDNANTFGTAMEDLQNAYQGFAKQNYTMLDNLKLGYGGTREEMQRLVKDAHAVNSAVDESSLSFDNIVLAIHTMQEQMQIAGTTSREAATTIEGSCNMAKAAWENWVTELGKDDADMGKLTTELVESVETAASNIVPRVATIVSTAVEQLPGVIATLAPVAGEAFMSIADSAMSALSGAFGGLDEIGAQVGPVLYDGIVNGLSFLSGAAADIMTRLGGYLAENLPSIMESGLQILTGLSESIAENAGVLAEGAANLIVGLAQGIADSLPTIIEQAPVIVQNLAGAINDNAPTLLGAGIQAIVTLALGIVQAIPTLIANIPAIFSAFVSAWSALDWLSLGRNAITFLGNGIAGMAGFVSTCGTNIVSAIRGAIANLPATLANLGKVAMYNLQGAISGAVGAVKGAALRIASNIESSFLGLPARVASIGRNIVQGIANGISGAAGVVVNKITGVVGGAIEAAKNLLGIHSPSRVFRKIFGYVMQGAALGIDDTADEPVKSMESAVGRVERAAAFDATVRADGPRYGDRTISGTGEGVVADGGASAVIGWLAENLPSIIAEFTPVMGESEFGRRARKAVAYA
jgi:phage-related protein